MNSADEVVQLARAAAGLDNVRFAGIQVGARSSRRAPDSVMQVSF